jgi:hypothetical protein
MQVAGLQVQLKKVVHVWILPAEFENGLELIKIPQPVDLVADLNRSNGKREERTRPARKARGAATFHKAPIKSMIYRRYIYEHSLSRLSAKIC